MIITFQNWLNLEDQIVAVLPMPTFSTTDLTTKTFKKSSGTRSFLNSLFLFSLSEKSDVSTHNYFRYNISNICTIYCIGSKENKKETNWHFHPIIIHSFYSPLFHIVRQAADTISKLTVMKEWKKRVVTYAHVYVKWSEVNELKGKFACMTRV